MESHTLTAGLRTAVTAFVCSRLLVAVVLTAIGGDAWHAFVHDWDAGWYGDVASYGYAGGPGGHDAGAPAFFPLLPLLEHLGAALGGDPDVWGLALANACSLAALVLLHDEARRRAGQRVAGLAVWATALFPLSFVLSTGYSEGPYLLLTLLAFRLARRPAAAFPALAASLLRPTGALLAPALAWDAWRAGRRSPIGYLPALAALLGPPLFFAYLAHARGTWTASLDAQRAIWGRVSFWHAPGSLADYAWQAVTWPRLTYLASLAGIPLCLLLLRVMWRAGWRDGWVVFAALTLVAPLTTGSPMSLPRFALGTFPYAIAGGLLLDGLPRRGRVAVLALSLGGLALALWGTYGAAEYPP